MLLQKAIEEVLACPGCKGPVAMLEGTPSEVVCTRCQSAYPTVDGIPVLTGREPLEQQEERRFRDAIAIKYSRREPRALRSVIARHHCIPIMRKHAELFRSRFKPGEWILDLGAGWGWHWDGQGPGAKIVFLDMSLENLRLARRLLSGNEHVVLVCADASALPVRENSISGVWSVQVFQHFPERVLTRVKGELDRVLRDEFVMEIHNLNPAWLHRVIYRLFRKELHCRGKIGSMELNRLSAEEWKGVWEEFRAGRSQISHGYSELFFHPNFHVRPRLYPLRLEEALVRHRPKLAALVARQVQVRVESRSSSSISHAG